MKISKAKFHGKETFNSYDVELSWGELMTIKNALASDHANPIADQTFSELSWWLDNIAGPGESEEDLKAEEEAAKSGLASPEAEGQPLKPRANADDLLPAPGKEEEESSPEEGPPEEGPPEEGSFEPRQSGEGPGEPEGDSSEPKRILRSLSQAHTGGEESETDRRLPPPPRE